MNTITKSLTSFSPLAPVFLNSLGLEDRNGNGTIDKAGEEGYEQFVAKYGDADMGYETHFGLSQGLADGRLDEKEIVDFYYLNIRYVFPQETALIETELAEAIRHSGIYSAWLDDGTIKAALEQVSPGLFWPERELPNALAKLYLAVAKSSPYWRTDDLQEAGYATLPEAVRTKKYTCYEATLLAFWFTSELRVRSIPAFVSLGGTTLHQFLYVPETAQSMDLTGVLAARRVDTSEMRYENPVQMIGQYYSVLSGLRENSGTAQEIEYLEKALQYQKNNDDIALTLMYCYLYPKDKASRDFTKAAALGEFILKHVDFEQLTTGKVVVPEYLKKSAAELLCYLIHCYSALQDKARYLEVVGLANKYFSKDTEVQRYLGVFKPWY